MKIGRLCGNCKRCNICSKTNIFERCYFNKNKPDFKSKIKIYNKKM